MTSKDLNQNEWDSLFEEEKTALEIDIDTEVDENGGKADTISTSIEELKNHPIIIRFEHETGKSLEWLLENVTIDPTGGDDDTDGLCAPSWPVSWPGRELSNDHLYILQGAATLVWVKKNWVHEAQKESVRDYIELIKNESLIKNRNRKNAKKSRRKVWADSLAKDLVKHNPDATFPQLWNMIPEDGEHHAGFEVYTDGETLWANSDVKGSHSMSKGHFRIEYVGKARKDIKHKP